MNFDFGNVLTRSGQIVWKHKILWIFGILAGCARGNGGGGGGGGTGYQTGPEGGQPPFDENFNRFMEQVIQWLNENWWVIVLVALVIIAISLFFYFLGIIGKIALIRGTYKAETGAEQLVFGELFSGSMPYFWRVFGLNLLVGLAILVILLPLLLLGGLLAIATIGVALICLIPLLCILVPVMWAVSVVLEQANTAIVIENLRMFDGLKRGWEVSKANFGPILIMALILGIGGAIVSVIISLPIFIAVVPLIPSFITGDFQPGAWWLSGLCLVALLPVLILLSGILNAYIQSAWTLTFMRLTAPKDNAPVLIEGNA